MSYSSASEGEIVESEEETKATTTQYSSKDGSINGGDRPRSLVSRSTRPPHVDGAYDENYDTGLDHDGKHRQREDDAQHRRPDSSTFPGGTSHGVKRPRPDDSHESNHDRSHTRRFKVHYERDEPHDTSSHSSGTQQDSQRHGASHRGRDPHSRYHADEHRERHRRQDEGSRNTHGNRQGARGTGITTRNGDNKKSDDNSRRRQSLDRESTYPHARKNRDGAEKERHAKQKASNTTMDGSSKIEKQPEHSTVADDVFTEVVDEAAVIEERRKRREALRAKHRSNETPLLHKALNVHAQAQVNGAPDGSDKQQGSHDVSPVVSAASTPQPESPQSPAMVSVEDDAELANRAPIASTNSPAGNSPSAADYDPSMDMQEDRLRKQQTHQGDDPSAGTYDETKDDDRDVLVPKQSVEQLKKKINKEFDMFADDDDDDDMFAADDQAKAHKKDDGTQAVHMPQAKQLDRSLLDDWDDPEGYYRIILGELLDGRYHVQTNLGKGVFSAVVRALDTKTEKLVAIKVIRKQESMYKAGIKEIETLQQLAEADPEDKKHVIRLERHFEHKGHLCMVFENLSINLREVLKKFGRDIGINIKAVRAYAQQIFLGLSLFKKCELLHADLKPDNILVNEARSSLKIADLGSAMSIDDSEITDVLVSRFYRAPEIMLGIKGDYAIDMWSIGCTLFELYTGKICFTGPSNNQMLKTIMECRGRIPNRLIKRSEYWAQHYDPDGTFISQEIDNVTRKEVVRRVNITRTIPAKELKARLFANSKGLSPAEVNEINLFADLLDKCLHVDPARRINPNEALKHGFISRTVSTSK